MEDYINLKYVLSALLYSTLGIVILLAAYWVIEKITPENTWKEVVEKQNIALAIIAAAFIIAIAIIISSAIHG